MKTILEAREYVQGITKGVKPGEKISFRCIECDDAVVRVMVTPDCFVGHISFYYNRLLSTCDKCRNEFHKQALKRLPEVVEALEAAFEEM